MGQLRILLLLLLAALLLGWGINAPTGLTGKDEYHLGLRIPLEMQEKQVWWIPQIDDQPRLKKPPMLYWAARASYDALSPSLGAGRGVTLLFALLLLGATLWLGKRYGESPRSGWLAAAVLLGTAGIASESRRLMLDVPVAALSVTAFCCYLQWLDKRRWIALLGVSFFLSAALMTKGPIALVACGSGLLALWLTERDSAAFAFRHWLPHLLMLVLALILPFVWYWDVAHQYADQLAHAAHDELEARQGGQISADALTGLITLAVPWTFVALHTLWTRRRERTVRFLGWWLALSLLPFCFINTFSRYLIASLVPLSLLSALALERAALPAWPRRLGSLLPLALCLLLIGLLWRWQMGGWAFLALAVLYFALVWWQKRPAVGHLLLSAILLWSTAWGDAFPHLGVNAVPPEVLDATARRPVVMFAGPQPALLPILQGRALRQTSQLNRELCPPGTLITLREEDMPRLQEQADQLGLHLTHRLRYEALISSGSGVRIARENAQTADWQKAWDQRSPSPLFSAVSIYEVMP